MNSLLPFRLPIAAALLFTAAGCVTANEQMPAPPASLGGGQTDEAASEAALDLPILGIAQVSVSVSDLERSRTFYGDVLGLPKAFELKDQAGQVTSVFFKVNDDQYIELNPGLQPDELVRQTRIVIQASDLRELHALYAEEGLDPGPIANGADGNPTFRIVLPNGYPIDFLQYVPTSMPGSLRGQLLTPERVSTHLLHAATMVRDDETREFFTKLGWGRMLPGSRGDYIETPSRDFNLETKNPPLDPEDPATREQYERELYGAVYHFSLEISDMHAARELMKQRGGFDDVTLRTAVGNNRHWLLHLFDPDGTRVEFMSEDTVPDAIPSFSVMQPGPPAPPILATERFVYPWP